MIKHHNLGTKPNAACGATDGEIARQLAPFRERPLPPDHCPKCATILRDSETRLTRNFSRAAGFGRQR